MRVVEVCKLDLENIEDISSNLLMPNGKLMLRSYTYYEKISRPNLQYFCHKHARYGIPTVELINYIQSLIDGRSAIEIGAGNGDLGYHLRIPMTDSKIQDEPEVREYYKSVDQPTIDYPKDVEKLEALEAIQKYKPQVVVGSWLTTFSPCVVDYNSSPYGIEEDQILNLVETYILIANLNVHGDKPILKEPHEEVVAPWIMSRSMNSENNRLFIWNNPNRNQKTKDIKEYIQ